MNDPDEPLRRLGEGRTGVSPSSRERAWAEILRRARRRRRRRRAFVAITSAAVVVLVVLGGVRLYDVLQPDAGLLIIDQTTVTAAASTTTTTVSTTTATSVMSLDERSKAARVLSYPALSYISAVLTGDEAAFSKAIAPSYDGSVHELYLQEQARLASLGKDSVDLGTVEYMIWTGTEYASPVAPQIPTGLDTWVKENPHDHVALKLIAIDGTTRWFGAERQASGEWLVVP